MCCWAQTFHCVKTVVWQSHDARDSKVTFLLLRVNWCIKLSLFLAVQLTKMFVLLNSLTSSDCMIPYLHILSHIRGRILFSQSGACVVLGTILVKSGSIRSIIVFLDLNVKDFHSLSHWSWGWTCNLYGNKIYKTVYYNMIIVSFYIILRWIFICGISFRA